MGYHVEMLLSAFFDEKSNLASTNPFDITPMLCELLLNTFSVCSVPPQAATVVLS